MAGKVREVIEPEGDKFGDFHLLLAARACASRRDCV
jgi:hypothetical protein